MVVGCADGDTEGLNDGTEDFSTHSRLLISLDEFQQHFASSQISSSFEFLKH